MLIEDADYFVKKVDFPNWCSRACCVENEDGTYTVLVNARYSDEQIREKFPHEVRHMGQAHHQDGRPVAEVEADAG